MIAQLRGSLAGRGAGAVVVDVGGVGYKAFMPLSDLEKLPAAGDPVHLFVSTYVREDAIALYGFLEEEQRDLFEILLGVSGVGPRVALGLLSVLATSDLLGAIANDEPRQLQRAPGVGLKLAQRIVLELKDRVAAMPRTAGPSTSADNPAADAVEALQSLGYNRTEASRAVEGAARELDGAGDASKLLRAALRILTQR